MLQGSVSSYQNVESGAFRGIEKLAVLQTGPSQVRSRERLMMIEVGPQIVRDVLVQEDLHGTG